MKFKTNYAQIAIETLYEKKDCHQLLLILLRVLILVSLNSLTRDTDNCKTIQECKQLADLNWRKILWPSLIIWMENHNVIPTYFTFRQDTVKMHICALFWTGVDAKLQPSCYPWMNSPERWAYKGKIDFGNSVHILCQC